VKKHSSVLTYSRNENYGVVYLQEKRVYIVVDKDGKILKDIEFEEPKEAIEFAFDAMELNIKKVFIKDKQMRQAIINRGDFKILAVTDENKKFLHFRVADRNEEILSDKKFQTACNALEFGNNMILEKGLLNDNK